MKAFFNLLFLLFTSFLFSQSNNSTEYFRHLRYNHISPFAEIIGVHPIDQTTAKSTSHYIFKYDKKNRLVEIINNHYHTEKRHPLASIGVYNLKIEYQDSKEIRTFYDPNGKRITNDRDVFKEVFTYYENNKKSQLQFYDLNDSPMESNWKIAQYNWSHENNSVIERRYNLNKDLVNVSPYFDFGITKIKLDSNGLPIAHYNLNDQLQVANNKDGIASYRDSFDSQGNHVKYSYYNKDEDLALNQWGFAYGVKSYDALGNNILLEQFDKESKVLRSRSIYTNSTISLSAPANSIDSSEIRRQSLGYLKALQELDPILMQEVLNDSLNKVTVGYDRQLQKAVARPTTYDQMIAFAEDWNKSHMKFPPVPNNKVEILGIYDQIASVKLDSDNWVEYLHLIKLYGKWKIINLIWQHKDVSRYQTP